MDSGRTFLFKAIEQLHWLSLFDGTYFWALGRTVRTLVKTSGQQPVKSRRFWDAIFLFSCLRISRCMAALPQAVDKRCFANLGAWRRAQRHRIWQDCLMLVRQRGNPWKRLLWRWHWHRWQQRCWGFFRKGRCGNRKWLCKDQPWRCLLARKAERTTGESMSKTGMSERLSISALEHKRTNCDSKAPQSTSTIENPSTTRVWHSVRQTSPAPKTNQKAKRQKAKSHLAKNEKAKSQKAKSWKAKSHKGKRPKSQKAKSQKAKKPKAKAENLSFLPSFLPSSSLPSFLVPAFLPCPCLPSFLPSFLPRPCLPLVLIFLMLEIFLLILRFFFDPQIFFWYLSPIRPPAPAPNSPNPNHFLQDTSASRLSGWIASLRLPYPSSVLHSLTMGWGWGWSYLEALIAGLVKGKQWLIIRPYFWGGHVRWG